MYSITAEGKFCAAHRLMDYPGLCVNIHGHNYKVEVTAESEKVDDLGMVLDFKTLKHLLMEILDEWDHALLYQTTDKFIHSLVSKTDMKTVTFSKAPTAENMAEVIFHRLLDECRFVTSVRVWETDGCVAEYREDAE